MRSRPSRAALVATLLLVGCASFELTPLPMDHPANPDAVAAPPPARSETLAYGPADIPSLPPVSSAAAVRPGGARPAEGGPAQTVVGEGEVVASPECPARSCLSTARSRASWNDDHGYRIDPPSLLEGLKPGDSIRFTIDVHRRAIIAIEKVK